MNNIPHAGYVNDEDAYNHDTDKIDNRKIKFKCPSCDRMNSPLCSPKTELLSRGRVGIDDCDEYHASFKTVCRCGQGYRFGVISG